MISAAMALITGLLGKIGFGWAGWGLSLFSGGFMGVISKMFSAIVTLATVAATWLLETLLTGISHIIQSVPAVIAVLMLSWGTYGYGKYMSPKGGAVSISKPAVSGKVSGKKPERTWRDRVLGN